MKVAPATLKNIALAAEALKSGKLVVMPTETVYGLAADATNRQAVRKIFSAKERPSDNPLIVHIADIGQIPLVASAFPKAAQILAERFWPGPLTLVLPKAEGVCAEVTGGLDSVAVRMPAHPVALSLIRKAGIPIAAPSANRFMKLSPTKAEHIDAVLARKVEMVLDGGPSKVGIESTVVDCTGEYPRILRPGGVSRGEIEAALGEPLGTMPPDQLRRSPGMYQRHYAPKATVKVVEKLSEKAAGLTFEAPLNDKQIKMPKAVGPYSAMLYDALHKLDRMKVSTIYIQEPPFGPEWETVRDRLAKASEPLD
ncbi:MAG TPA: L-threonylcarbamoyladenylate synthase [Fimbriimonadaceae bacterium]|nr:L-threonylcarbamoyladenylate synthase [Fimbriimonadaceae bacterium]